MHDTCTIHRIRILITNVPKFDNKSTVTRGAGGEGDRPLNRAAPAHGPTTRSHRTSIMTSMHIFKDLTRLKVPRPAVINQAKMANPPNRRLLLFPVHTFTHDFYRLVRESCPRERLDTYHFYRFTMPYG